MDIGATKREFLIPCLMTSSTDWTEVVVLRSHTPEIEGKLALAGRRTLEGLVRTELLGEVATLLDGGIVDALEDLLVERLGFLTVVIDLEHGEGVSKTLNTQSDGPVSQVGVLGLLDGVVVPVDDLVQVADQFCGHILKFLEVEGLGSLVHEHWQSDGGKVADSHFLVRGILQDLSAEVTGLDGAQVLLVALGIAVILVEHVRGIRSQFDL